MNKIIKFVDPEKFISIIEGTVKYPESNLIEFDITYDCGSTQRVYFTLCEYMEMVLEIKFQDMGYDMKLIEDYGQLKYEAGSDSGYDDGMWCIV
jgi:hypothetical protein